MEKSATLLTIANKLRIVLLATTWLVGILMLLLKEDLARIFETNYLWIVTLGISFIFAGSGIVLFEYLRGSFSAKIPRSDLWPSAPEDNVSDEIRQVRHELRSFEYSVSDLRAVFSRFLEMHQRSAAQPIVEVTDEERQELLNTIKDRLSVEILAPTIEVATENIQKQLQEISNHIEANSTSIQHLQNIIGGNVGSILSREDRSEIAKQVQLQLQALLPQEFLTHLEGKYGKAIRSSGYLYDLRKQFQAAKSRLSLEISALSRRGNVNLIIGSLTTVAAVSMLAYIVLHTAVAISDWKTVLPGVLLRLSIVIFIEVFSFFFLRLYRSGLTEIKYFQNELTNLDAKFIALESAVVSADPEAMTKIVEELARTDRNFVLRPGESTVDLERLRAENQTIKDTLQSISTIFSRVPRA